MLPIRIPTDQGIQNYLHVFFTSPDIWNVSVLDHEITPSLLEDINQHSDDSLLQDSIFDEYGDLHHRAIQTFIPLQALTVQVPDISHFLHFSFWEPIYYKVDESEPDHRFPSQSNEKRGH